MYQLYQQFSTFYKPSQILLPVLLSSLIPTHKHPPIIIRMVQCMVELKILLDDVEHHLFEVKLSQRYQKHLSLHAVQQKLLCTLQACVHCNVVSDSVRLQRVLIG